MLRYDFNSLDHRKISDEELLGKIYVLDCIETGPIKLYDNGALASSNPQHKKEDSTSNTQAINESSFDISPNSSGVMLLEQIAEIKKLFEMQGKEIENVGQAINTPAAERMKEMFNNFNKEQPESMMNSLYNQGSGIWYGESSRALISPVPNDYDGTAFASSLMSLSDYQVKVTDIRDDNSPFLNFIKSKYKNLSFMKRVVIGSHIPGINI